MIEEERYYRKPRLIIDILVVVIFLSTAVFSIYLFRADIMRTIEVRDEEPAGIIVIRNNVVQRRFADRVLWERLFVDSPVFSGDLIRAAEVSDATIHLDENQLNLNENTLIRIQRTMGARIPFSVELQEGTISITTGEGNGILLYMMGHQIHAMPGTVLSAELSEDGVAISVSEGTAVFIIDGEIRELTTGMIFAQDREGAELIIAAAVVTHPQPNARFLKDSHDPLPVDFSWNRINLEPYDILRMEIAENRNFTRNVRVIETLGDQAQVYFDAGHWYWRLSYGDAVLSVGELTVVDASGPELLSPVTNSIFRYLTELPQVRFQWEERQGASHYILEICGTGNFADPYTRRVSATSFVKSPHMTPQLETGTWYWRVLPVYSFRFAGRAGFSLASSFQTEQTSNVLMLGLEVPEPVASRRYHTVQPGDSLNRLAFFFYGDPFQWVRLAEVNNIANPDLIFIDQVLFVP